MICKQCEKRHPGCHSTCPEYNTWKSEKDRLNEIVRKKRQAEAEMIDAKVKLCEKARRKKKRW
jgi:hypothetical protein